MRQEKPSKALPVEATAALRKAITLRHAVVLYVSSVLGSGVLVLPGLAARLAGPGSLLAWAFLSVASYPFAYTFSSLSARNPEAGGVYGFAKEAFGRHAATIAGWLFGLWYIAGAPAVILVAASYLGYAFPLGRLEIHLVACAVIVVPYVINLHGIAFSSRVQLGIVAAIVALLVLAVAFSAPSVKAASFSPFLPRGIVPVGTAAALIFWSYLGYENVSNVAEEFKDPTRDFHRSILASVVIIGLLYLSVAVVTVGTRAYAAGGSVAPFAAMFSNVLGVYGAQGTAVLAVVIIFGTANAYVAGISRVAFAVARDGGLPRVFARVSKATGAPTGSLTLLTGLSLIMLVIYYVFTIDLQTALLIPSGAAVLVYIIGSASGAKLLKVRGIRKSMPWISFVISVAVLPFVGPLALVALLLAVCALAYSLLARRPSTLAAPATAVAAPAVSAEIAPWGRRIHGPTLPGQGVRCARDSPLSPAEVEETVAIITRGRIQRHSVVLPERLKTRNWDSVMAVIEAVNAKLAWPAAGWKIGAAAEEIRRAEGVPGPCPGQLSRDGVRESPAELPPSLFINYRCSECEFAFRMGRDLPPREAPYTESEVADAVEALLPALEIGDTVFDDWYGASGYQGSSMDNGGAAAFVHGAPVRQWRQLDLPNAKIDLSLNGRYMKSGYGRAAMGNPLTSLTWMANWLRVRGKTLHAGEVVSTGTCTGHFFAAPGDRLDVDFGRIGKVIVTYR